MLKADAHVVLGFLHYHANSLEWRIGYTLSRIQFSSDKMNGTTMQAISGI